MKHKLYLVSGFDEAHFRPVIRAVSKRTGGIPLVLDLVSSGFDANGLQCALEARDVVVTTSLAQFTFTAGGIRARIPTDPLQDDLHALLMFRSEVVLSVDPLSTDPYRYNVIRSKQCKANSSVTADDLSLFI